MFQHLLILVGVAVSGEKKNEKDGGRHLLEGGTGGPAADRHFAGDEDEAGAHAGAGAEVGGVRLPGHLEPLHYKLELVPFIHPGNFTIRGRVEIEVLCRRAAANITLHAADLTINNDTVAVFHGRRKSLKNLVSGVEHDAAREFLILHTEQLAPDTPYLVRIEYTAYLKDNLRGFYRSVYHDVETNTTEYIAVTQFQAADARRAFPCFDEPGLKATYEVCLCIS